LAIILSVVIKLKDCSKSQAVTYTKQVLIYQKQCKIGTWLLKTTNGNWYVAYWLATFCDLQGHLSYFCLKISVAY